MSISLSRFFVGTLVTISRSPETVSYIVTAKRSKSQKPKWILKLHARTGDPISMRDIGQQHSSWSCSLKRVRRRSQCATNSAFAKSLQREDERAGSKMELKRERRSEERKTASRREERARLGEKEKERERYILPTCQHSAMNSRRRKVLTRACPCQHVPAATPS